MHSLVCFKFMGNYYIANRLNRMLLQIPEDLYQFFWQYQSSTSTDADLTPIVKMLAKIKFTWNKQDLLRELLVRPCSTSPFGKASYEITEICNFQCQHCLLGNSRRSGLSLSKKCQILDRIAETGCVWLQLTGGEPTIDPDFVAIYTYAYDLGFLITVSTNGSRLSNPQIQALFKERPPWRITISLYGASPESFTALTGNAGAWHDFQAGLTATKGLGLWVRVNIIQTCYNQHEISVMQQFTEDHGFEHHTFAELYPALNGDLTPTNLMADCSRIDWEQRYMQIASIPQGGNWLERCGAGRTFYHVDCQGLASICQSARSKQVSLLEEQNLADKLSQFAEELLCTPASCTSCSHWQACLHCPPKMALWQQAGKVFELCPYQEEGR